MHEISQDVCGIILMSQATVQSVSEMSASPFESAHHQSSTFFGDGMDTMHVEVPVWEAATSALC